MGPKARRDQLIVTETDQDRIVYDERTSHLHIVPAVIAAVWRSCDGTATVDQIASSVGLSSLQVESALLQLRKASLIEGVSPREVPTQGRRRFLKRAALGAAIVSVTAPMAASASSVAPAGQCWWMDSYSYVWVEVPEVASYEECRALDDCSNDGGCYKWTVGQNDDYGW